MYVCVESDAALLAWLSHSVIRQEPPDLPQEGETSSRSGLESSAIKKKPKAKGSREETNKRDICFLEKCSVCFPLREESWRSHSSLLSPLCFESCIGSWLGQTAGHTEHVIRVAIGIPQATGFTSPEHKSASHTKETPAQRLHTKPKHVADCSIQASPDRDTETASLSLPPTHDMNSTQGHCSTRQLQLSPRAQPLVDLH